MDEQQQNEDFEIHLGDLWQIFLRCWWIILAAAVVVGSGMFLFLRLTHKDVYTARTSIWVMREKTSSQTATSDVSIANNILNDVIVISGSDRVLNAVREETGTEWSNSVLKSMTKVTKEEETHVVYVAVTAKTREEAQMLADSVGRQTCETMNNYLFDNENYTKILDEATIPSSPSNPISRVRIFFAATAAAVLVYMLFFILHILDDKINTADDVQGYLSISVLGQIPNRRDVAKRKNRYGTYYRMGTAGDGKGGDAK